MCAACWLCSLQEVIRTGSYTILAIGYTDKELSYLKKCFSELAAAIEIQLASDAIFELPVKSMQYNCIVANPELLERLSYINLFRQLSQVPILLLSVEQCELSEAATLTVHCTKLRTDNTGKADQAEPMQKTPMTFIKIAELELCVEQRMTMICGQPVNLTQKEFDLLLLLASNPKRVFTYEMIMDIVWHEDYTFYSRKAIHNHISNVKKKLRTVASGQQCIVSVHGVGYKFDVTQNNE